MNIQKAAVRASNNAMRGYIPHNAIVSQGARITARQQAQEKPQRGRNGRRDRSADGSGRNAVFSPGSRNRPGQKHSISGKRHGYKSRRGSRGLPLLHASCRDKA